MYRRNIEAFLLTALQDTRVVLLNGARQTGKSTLARKVADESGGRYLTLDDETLLAVARSDASALLETSSKVTVIDEVQRAPDLFSRIKIIVDRDPRPGRFLLTGSANIFLLPRLSESLAGRMEIFPLAPLSQDEIGGRNSGFIDHLFSEVRWPRIREKLNRLDICERILKGGFPEVLSRTSSARDDAWYRSYISSLIQRDVRDLAGIDGLTFLPRLLSLLAARVTGLLNISELSRTTQIPLSTLRRYLTLLEALFLLQLLPPWSTNTGKRLVKSPKIHLVDSGLAAHLAGTASASELARSNELGSLLETFVVQECRKQLAWCDTRAQAFHFRSSSGREVDLVLEGAGRAIVGIEVKASSSINQRDFAGLDALASEAGRKFHKGIILYLGEEAVPFSDRMAALPVNALWEWV